MTLNNSGLILIACHIKTYLNRYSDPLLSVKLDPDPHGSEKLDPDLHCSEKLDPDPHLSEKQDQDLN
jgi:hypothetical protein